MARYTDTVQDDYGRPVEGAEVYVTLTNGGAAPAMTNDAGATITNPLLTDSFGAFSFNTPDTYVDLDIRFGGRKRNKAGNMPVGRPDLRDVVDPRGFGAKGDGVTDDAAALQAALSTGKRVWLQRGLTYAFGTRLFPPEGGGFVGGGDLLMLTGAGKFDAADYLQSYDRTIGIFAEFDSNIRIEARITMQANAAIRTCCPVWIRSCTNVHLDLEISGFKELRFGAVEWNSNVGGFVRLNAHDCATDSTTLPTMQLTALSVDNNRFDPGTGPITSTGLSFDVDCEDFEMGASAIAQYGYQTDAVSLMGSGYAGHTGSIRARNVHEPLDCWSDHNVVDVSARNCLFGAKVIYGASNNVIRGTVNRYMKNAVYLGGGGTQPTRGNRLYFCSTGGGEIGPFSGVSAVLIEDNSAQGTTANYVEMTAYGNGVDLDNGAVISGTAVTDNEVLLQGSGFVAVGQTTGTVISQGNRIRRTKGTLVRASLSDNTVYADLAVIICNTETWDRAGEYDPTTGIFTAKAPGVYRVRIKGLLSVNSGQAYGTYIDKNGAEHSRKRETNAGVSGASLAHDHAALVLLAPGDTIRFRHDGASTNTWFGGGSATFIEIEEA